MVAGFCVVTDVQARRSGGERVANPCVVNQPTSLEGKTAATITFVNKTNETVSTYWLNYSGQRVFYKALLAGQQYNQPTFLTHPWVVLDPNGKCVGSVVATAPTQTYVITIGTPPAPKPKPKTKDDYWWLAKGTSCVKVGGLWKVRVRVLMHAGPYDDTKVQQMRFQGRLIPQGSDGQLQSSSWVKVATPSDYSNTNRDYYMTVNLPLIDANSDQDEQIKLTWDRNVRRDWNVSSVIHWDPATHTCSDG
jgi:hypothetical protein